MKKLIWIAASALIFTGCSEKSKPTARPMGTVDFELPETERLALEDAGCQYRRTSVECNEGLNQNSMDELQDLQSKGRRFNKQFDAVGKAIVVVKRMMIEINFSPRGREDANAFFSSLTTLRIQLMESQSKTAKDLEAETKFRNILGFLCQGSQQGQPLDATLKYSGIEGSENQELKMGSFTGQFKIEADSKQIAMRAEDTGSYFLGVRSDSEFQTSVAASGKQFNMGCLRLREGGELARNLTDRPSKFHNYLECSISAKKGDGSDMPTWRSSFATTSGAPVELTMPALDKDLNDDLAGRAKLQRFGTRALREGGDVRFQFYEFDTQAVVNEVRFRNSVLRVVIAFNDDKGAGGLINCTAKK
jgi:hypothetical protein